MKKENSVENPSQVPNKKHHTIGRNQVPEAEVEDNLAQRRESEFENGRSNNRQQMAQTNETIDQIIQQKMMEMFTEQFESLKDKVVTVIANKISTLIEENNNLRSEIWQLRDTSETEKKELAVVHQLVTTFNSKLSNVQKEHEKAIQEMRNKVQSMEEMICKTKQSTQDELKSISDTVTVCWTKYPSLTL